MCSTSMTLGGLRRGLRPTDLDWAMTSAPKVEPEWYAAKGGGGEERLEAASEDCSAAPTIPKKEGRKAERICSKRNAHGWGGAYPIDEDWERMGGVLGVFVPLPPPPVPL